MKIRNGFVSNSSSASFIVTWKWKEGYGPKQNILAASLLQFFASHNQFSDEEHVTIEKLQSPFDYSKLDNLGEDGEDRLEKIREVIKSTVKNDNCFTTSFWTCMYNENKDFGETAMELMFNMLILSNFGLEYNFKIEE